MKTSAVLLVLFFAQHALAQSVGIGTESPNQSAILDVSSTTQGILVPRMTTAQRSAISNAATGLLVFDMTTNSFWFKGNAQWIELIDSSNSVVHKNGPNIFMGMGGFVGIGTSTPGSKLDVNGDTHITGILGVAGLAVGGIAAAGGVAAFGGAVGVGTATPTVMLEVASGIASEGIVHTDGLVRLATSTTADGARISTTTNHPLHLTAANSLNGILITPLGAVGIGGVVAPTGMLDVKSALASPGIRHTDGNVTLGTRTANDAGIVETVSPHALKLNANNGNDHLVITPQGNVGINTAMPNARLEVKTPANENGIRHTSGNVSMATRIGASKAKLTTMTDHPLEFSANNMNDQLTLDTSGNVGIGTPNAMQKLHVSGNAVVSDKLGIGTTNPRSPLQFSNSLANRKAVLWESANNDHEYFGFGINPSTLRYQVDGPAASHVFYSASGPSASTELMRIKGSGNVGVNMTNPLNRMDIHSGASSRTGTHATNRPLYVTGDITDGNGIEFRHTNGAQGIGLGPTSIYASGSGANQDLGFNAKGTGDLIFRTNGNARMKINENGNVAIGNHEPHAPLQFSNTLANRKLVLWEVGNNDHEFYGTGMNPKAMRYQVGEPTADHVFYSAQSPSASNELMRITGDGKVGIGTSSPAKTLDVDGDAQISGQLGIGYEVVGETTSIPGLSGEENAYCDCPPGMLPMGGGWEGDELDVIASAPTPYGWLVIVNNFNIDPQPVHVYAICARLSNY